MVLWFLNFRHWTDEKLADSANQPGRSADREERSQGARLDVDWDSPHKGAESQKTLAFRPEGAESKKTLAFRRKGAESLKTAVFFSLQGSRPGLLAWLMASGFAIFAASWWG